MNEKGQTRMDLLEEIENVLTDAGGPGEFKYDGGPKPYVKKDGTTSKKSQERVESHDKSFVPVPTSGQVAQAQELVNRYFDFKNRKGPDPDLNWDVAGQDITTHPEYQERLAKFVSEKSKVYDDLINEYETRAKSPKESETSEWLQSQAEHFKEQKAKNTSPEWSQEILRRDILQKQEAQRQKEAYETRKTVFKSGSGKLSKKDKVLLKEQKETTKQWARELAYGENDEFYPDESDMAYVLHDISKMNQIRPITQAHVDAIEAYQGSANMVQGYLALGSSSGRFESDDTHIYDQSDILHHVEALSDACKSYEASEDWKGYRGISSERFKGADKGTNEEQIAKNQKAVDFVNNFLEAKSGDIFHNPAFASISHSREYAESFSNRKLHPESQVTLEVSIRKGQNGLDMNQGAIGDGDLLFQREVVLDKGQHYRIDHVDKENRLVKISLLNKDEVPKNTAIDSIAIDYTFIPEEHPRQKDPDWGGKPQEPGQSTTPLNTVVPTPEAHAAASEMVDKYYESQGKDRPSKVSMVSKALKSVSEFLGLGEGPETMSASRRNFLKKSVAMAASQALPHVPGGDMMKAISEFAGVSEKSITGMSETTSAKHYSELAYTLSKKFWSGYKLLDGRDPFEEDFEENIGSEAQDVTSAEGLKDFLENQAFDLNQSLYFGAGESVDSPLFFKQFLENAPNIAEVLKLAGSSKTADDIANKIQMADNLLNYYTSQAGYRFDKAGNVFTESGEAIPEVSEALSELRSILPVPSELVEMGYEGEAWPENMGDFVEADKVAFEERMKKWNSEETEPVEETTEPAEQAESAEVAETESIGMPPRATAIATKVLEKVEEAKAKVQSYIEEIEHPGRLADSAPTYLPDWRYIQHELQYVIESPKGTLRTGHGFQVRMPADYGYIVGFIGADGDEVDCYLGPNPWSQVVYVVDQNKLNSPIFDEHKCLIGFASEYEARRCYISGHHMGDKIFRGIKALSMREFINWLQRGNLTQPITK